MIRTLILAVCCVMFPSLCPASSGWETVQSALKSIHAGWNLANSLDAVRNDLPYGSKVSDFETGWGQPVTTPEMIHMMKEAGFNAIRVPVTWSQHMDEGGNVRKEWMDRVEQVVKYVLDENMYCIVNVHHDTGTDGWIRADWNTYLGAKDKFRKLWKQIADRFKKYDSKLLFEGYNEILDLKPNWHESDADSYKAVNAFAQDFVDVVRKTGGNNRKRNLIVNTYSAGTSDATLKYFAMPKDVVENHLAVEVHAYCPWSFTDATDNYSTTVFDAKAEQEVTTLFRRLNERFVAQGIPLLLGEYRALDKGNLEERLKYTRYTVREAAKYGIPCFYWDGLLDRKALKWSELEIVNAIINNVE